MIAKSQLVGQRFLKRPTCPNPYCSVRPRIGKVSAKRSNILDRQHLFGLIEPATLIENLGGKTVRWAELRRRQRTGTDRLFGFGLWTSVVARTPASW